MQVAVIAASCCAICIWEVMMVVVVACCCFTPYRLALMLALTFAPCACGVSTVQTFHLYMQVVIVTSFNLRW